MSTPETASPDTANPPPASERAPSSGAAIGSPEWTAAIREIEAKREAATVYQLAFWPDEQRAMPTDFLACALFAALHGKNTQYLRGERIATVNGYTVAYTGKRLTQVHADIVMGALHLMRGRPQGDTVQFRVRSFLRLIGRHTGKTDRDSFRQLVDDVIATSLRITTPDGKISYSGSILTKAKDVTEDDDTLFVLEVNRELAKLFASGFGTIDWEKRKTLMRQPLCLWLQLYFSKFGTKPVAVAELHRLSGSTAPVKKFRQNLRAALPVLAEKDIVQATYDRDTDTIHRAPPNKRAPLPALPPTASQHALPLAPCISGDARATFAGLYPSRDVEKCVADWQAWLVRKKLTADNPDKAFLGFAKKWAESTQPPARGESKHPAN